MGEGGAGPEAEREGGAGPEAEREGKFAEVPVRSVSLLRLFFFFFLPILLM